MVDLAVVASTFAAIFLAELPDKSLFASVVMATRMRASHVWTGVALAFVVHVCIAAFAGTLLGLLPRPIVLGCVTVLFLAGAAVLFFGGDGAAEEEREAEERLRKVRARPALRSVTTAFVVVFVSEWGDLTQITTVSRVAHTGDPVSVGLGALAALWAVAGLGVTAGRKAVQLVPLRVVRRIAAGVFVVLAAWSFADLLSVL